METTALTLILILGPGLTHACTLLSITQNPPLLVAWSGAVVTVSCDVLVGGGSAEMSSMIYRAGRPSKPLHTWNDSASNTSVTHNITVTETAVYYCRVSCAGRDMDGHGTYIHVRDSGYVAPSSASYSLCSGLIALCILLLIPAVTGTYLLLPFIWRREAQSPSHSRGQGPAVMESSVSRAAVEDGGGSLYTSLEPRSEEVYDILEEEAKTTDSGGPKKHQVEIHDVAPRSPKRKLKLQAKTSSYKGKPPINPKPKKNVSEINVYENLRA